jgi:hypothetical protein
MNYETKDIWIASALHAMGFEAEAEKVSERQFIFVFDDSKELREALNNYTRGKLAIDVSSLQTSYKTLKNLVFNQ